MQIVSVVRQITVKDFCLNHNRDEWVYVYGAHCRNSVLVTLKNPQTKLTIFTEISAKEIL